MTAPLLVCVEFTVPDLEASLELLVRLLGLQPAGRSRHPRLDAEIAHVTTGSLMINLICPTDTGEGVPVPNPEPRFSQLTFALPEDADLSELRDRLVDAGAAVVQRDRTMFYLDPEMVRGVLGTDSSLVCCLEEVLAAAGPAGPVQELSDQSDDGLAGAADRA